MLRLATRSKLLASSARVIAPAVKTQERQLQFSVSPTDQKVAIFSLAGGVLPSMDPVFHEYAVKYTIPPKPDDIKQKVLMEADDAQLLENINMMLASRNASVDENTADLMDAIASIRGEGWKTILVDDAAGINNVPLNAEIRGAFDSVVDKLTSDIVEGSAAAKSDIVYVDNSAENLAAAEAMGISTVAVGSHYGEALSALEGKLGAPLKACIPGYTFNWYDRANNPHKNDKMYYFLWFSTSAVVFAKFASTVVRYSADYCL